MGINRDIALCVPRLQAVWAYLKEQYAARYPEAPRIILVETFRSAAVQTAYYAQGRQPLAEINRLRALAGLEPIGPTDAKRKITYKPAGHSKHERMTADLQPAAQAFDIGFVQGGKMVWDAVNYQRAARIATAQFHDVIWGGDWKGLVDLPHFEV